MNSPRVDINNLGDFTSERRVIRLPEVEKLTGVCGMTIWRLERQGSFPKRFKLNPDGGPTGAVGWNYAAVMRWLDDRERASLQEAPHEAAN